MPPSPNPGRKPLISLSKSLTIVALALLSTTLNLRAQSALNNLTVAEQYLLAAANEARASQGLPPVRLDPILTGASALHAREMADHASISHQFDGEPELAIRGANAGAHFSLISENVGEAPTSVIIHDLWMNSPGHRANLLDPSASPSSRATTSSTPSKTSPAPSKPSRSTSRNAALPASFQNQA
jgi:uncharacterized protein YkwD